MRQEEAGMRPMIGYDRNKQFKYYELCLTVRRTFFYAVKPSGTKRKPNACSRRNAGLDIRNATAASCGQV